MENLSWEVLFNPADLDTGVFCAIVLVEEEDWQFHDLEVNYKVPENDFVLRDKDFLSEYGVSFLCKCVNELFVQGAWRK